MDEIEKEMAQIVLGAIDEYRKTGAFKKFFEAWDEMDKVEQDSLVAFVLEKLSKSYG